MKRHMHPVAHIRPLYHLPRKRLRHERSRAWTCGFALTLGVVAVSGCKDLTGSTALPSGLQSPSTYYTPSGAIGMYTAAVQQVEVALPQYLIESGLITDELEDAQTGASAGKLLLSNGVQDALDERMFSNTVTVGSYGQLQAIRTYATQAIGALAVYDTLPADSATSKIRRGELYADEGYAEIMLADLFCSGVPLSTLDFQHDFTYAPSSTTKQLYQAALAKFDTALSLADTSTQVRYLAMVGQGRVYLDLGQYAPAADDVASVPNTFQFSYPINVYLNGGGSGNPTAPAANMSNLEGVNGLPFRNGDSRTKGTVACIPNATQSNCADTLFFPVKYATKLQTYNFGGNASGSGPFVLASGVEARLIQAEAALNGIATGTGDWITQLNALRTAAGLSSIADPGSGNPAAQVDTLLTERAYWLFLTGHRQGDLRRLLRQYNQYAAFQDQASVYPTGVYFAPGVGRYGTAVVAPIPPTESANPLFNGCIDNEP